ncbi:hypothetical protein Q4I30_006215 [Leishmania utingensis]|uniref:Uncharacterized protein n=1 Tax=Leishmania utingensis TaxID=653362 RepID=A0AAW3A237_9TRYP
MGHAERERSQLGPYLHIPPSLRRGDVRSKRVAVSPMNIFCALPLMALYAGFHFNQTEDAQGSTLYDFRMHAAELLRLPNLAMYTANMVFFEAIVCIFYAVWKLLQKRGWPLVVSEPTQLSLDPSNGVMMRDPTPDASCLQRLPQKILVLVPMKGLWGIRVFHPRRLLTW